MPRRDPLLTALGRRVRALRVTQGLTQEQLGEKADLDQTYISDIERGERNPSVLIVGQLARAFRLSLAELFASGVYVSGEKCIPGDAAEIRRWARAHQSEQQKPWLRRRQSFARSLAAEGERAVDC